MKYALGVDIGGTKISVALGNSRGKILAKKLIATTTGRKSRQCIETLAQTLESLKSQTPHPSPLPFKGRGKGEGKLLGIGVGIPGPMDPEKGVVQRSPHLKGWQGVPLKSFLEKRLKLPVFIANDASAAALGEKLFGQGRRAENFVYLTVSTGIGSGIILNGRLLLGASFGAGEIGHTVIFPGGERCGCGQSGCLEAYSSGTAIAQYVRREVRRGRRFKFPLTPTLSPRGRGKGEGGEITAEIVALAAEAGDPLALEVFRQAGYFLGIGLANTINLLNPEMLILGGSVVKSSRFFWASMSQSLKQHAWPSLHRACRVVKTQLGDRVGDLGALALVFSRGFDDILSKR